jgi:hypothetical protein
MRKRLTIGKKRDLMRRYVSYAIMVIVSAIILIMFSSAAAIANSQHSFMYDNLESCRLCHQPNRTLDGKSSYIESEKSLCLSCHGHEATGASTDVEWGVARGQESGLRSGGFEKALLDTTADLSLDLSDTTSSHAIGGSGGMAWGYGDPSDTPDYGMDMTLRCSSCHNPHGNGNYRSLRLRPLGSSLNSEGVYLEDEAEKDYTLKYTDDALRDLSYVPDNINEWCSQCHSRYLADSDYASHDAVFTYGHTSSLEGGCLSCHMSHGTTSTMSGWAALVELPDGTRGNGTQDSRLLAMDNRGICVSCHTDIYDN